MRYPAGLPICAFRKLHGMLRSSGHPMMARSEAGFNKEKPAGSSGGLSFCAGNRFRHCIIPAALCNVLLATLRIPRPSLTIRH
jgi:hypothetical protein